MIFVWTSEGGPLQYIGLGLFLLQLLPQILPELSRGWNLGERQREFAGGLVVGLVSFALWKFRHEDARTALRQRASELVQQFRGREWSYYAMPALLGVFLGCALTLGSAVDLLRWLPYVGQLLTMASVLGIGRQLEPQHHQDTPTAQAKLEEMTALVGRMPLEPFVPEEEMATTPISKLKQMLQHRGATQEELNSFVERQNLVDALKKRRKVSDTCCICFEDLAKDDPMRVLPNCGHELHVECLDKWVYTFATNPSKIRQQPTCPLCKEGMAPKK